MRRGSSPLQHGAAGRDNRGSVESDDDDDGSSDDSCESRRSGRRNREQEGIGRRRPRESVDGNSDNEGDEDSTSEIDEETGAVATVSCALSEALVSDLLHRPVADPMTSKPDAPGESSHTRSAVCCICHDKAAVYTCPGCKRRTCSLTCVRVHKAQDRCTGERNAGEFVPLSEFGDEQLRRDYHFLEDCQRVAKKCASGRPREWFHYDFHTLPPPLYQLREAAKLRGVLLQFISEGMKKRDLNTTRYDKRRDTITWRCEFRFVGNVSEVAARAVRWHALDQSSEGSALRLPHSNFSVSTNWGNERHLLGDILDHCAETNPLLKLYHIRRGYSRASRWVHGSDLQSRTKRDRADEEQLPQQPDPQPLPEGYNDDGDVAQQDGDGAEGESHASIADREGQRLSASSGGDRGHVVVLHETDEPGRPMTVAEMQCRSAVSSFLQSAQGEGGYTILQQAERLGSRILYFPMNPNATLHDNLRTVFFVNEFPVFYVVRDVDLVHFELVSEDDKEAIRESFRKKERPTFQDRLAALPKRSELDAAQQELYAKIPCRQFVRTGLCARPEGECPYWHCAASEVPACRSMMAYGECPKGARCSFQHDPEVVAAAKESYAAQAHGRGRDHRFRGGRGGHSGFDRRQPRALPSSSADAAASAVGIRMGPERAPIRIPLPSAEAPQAHGAAYHGGEPSTTHSTTGTLFGSSAGTSGPRTYQAPTATAVSTMITMPNATIHVPVQQPRYPTPPHPQQLTTNYYGYPHEASQSWEYHHPR